MTLYRLSPFALALAATMACISPTYAQDSEKALESVIAEQQKQLPIMLDPITRIDNISYANHNVLYKITLYGFDNRPGERVYYESYLTQQIQKALCSQTAYLLLLELGNKITYRYSSSQAEPITEITFGPETCRKV
ncbi:hypothetical protein [Pseudomonas huanghezhanensis]|uniref:hypothetical protein n=1 Tax=Pseudomonas huanghezhanensis TaxID=3002903 RepID=UPI00228604E7|nr:hypothetical protein [Pseudomonas sp. BSw22131]